MPTTLIATNAGIGLGIMAQTIERNVKSIDSVIICEYPERLASTKISYSNSKKQLKFNLGNKDTILKDLEKMSNESNRKFLFIETSWGLSEHLRPDNCYYIPMWEQGSTESECSRSSNIISITKKTVEVVKNLGYNSMYLPYPIEMNQDPFFPKVRAQNLLHNAGSLGGNLRKGTIEAIKIFQKSGLSKLNRNLVIHSWKDPTYEILQQIREKPDNIFWRQQFFDDYRQIYENFDLLLFSSKLEGHAMVALEAMSCGLPVICTDASPMNEYEDDEKYKIPVERVEGNFAFVDCDLGAERLRKICEDDNLFEKSSASRNFVLQNMSWNSLRKSYDAIFS